MKKHKHYDCIVAWAKGQEIQYKSPISFDWHDSICPSWATSFEYRIKPTKTHQTLIGCFQTVKLQGDEVLVELDLKLRSDQTDINFLPAFEKWLKEYNKEDI